MMSDAHDQHQSPIKTPKQLIIAVVAALVVPIAIIVLLVTYVAGNKQTGEGSSGMTPQAIAERIAPVAKLEIKDASAPRVLQTGEAVYKASCVACHGAGIGGAPKFGDAGVWAPRLAQGAQTLFSHAIMGFQGKAGAMPAKGGNSDLDDVEVQRAVVYMANAAGGKLKEPEVKAAAAATAQAAPVAAAAPAAAVAAVAAAKQAAPAPAASAGGGADAGKKLYESACAVCHSAGIAGAPKFGDKAAWKARIAQGEATLVTHAIKGFQGKAGMMPPKGGSSASDDDIKAAVRYMVAAGK